MSARHASSDGSENSHSEVYVSWNCLSQISISVEIEAVDDPCIFIQYFLNSCFYIITLFAYMAYLMQSSLAVLSSI